MCYQTNLTDARWQIIAEFIEDGRKRQSSLRSVVDAILYLVKTGCQWRYLPLDFPKWQLVYYYFRKFETTGAIEIIHDQLREQVRVKKGKEGSPSLGFRFAISQNCLVNHGERFGWQQKSHRQKAVYLDGHIGVADGSFDCRGECR